MPLEADKGSFAHVRYTSVLIPFSAVSSPLFLFFSFFLSLSPPPSFVSLGFFGEPKFPGVSRRKVYFFLYICICISRCCSTVNDVEGFSQL